MEKCRAEYLGLFFFSFPSTGVYRIVKRTKKKQPQQLEVFQAPVHRSRLRSSSSFFCRCFLFVCLFVCLFVPSAAVVIVGLLVDDLPTTLCPSGGRHCFLFLLLFLPQFFFVGTFFFNNFFFFFLVVEVFVFLELSFLLASFLPSFT